MIESVRKILLADGDTASAKRLCAHLLYAGFEVELCTDGHAALDYALTHQPELAILDAELPGMNGLEVLRQIEIESLNGPKPIVMLTGCGNQDDIILSLDGGAQDYLVKPYNVSEVTARIRAQFRLLAAQRSIVGLNVQLADEVAKKTSRLEMLYGFVRELNQAREEKQIYDLVIDAVRQATGSRRISIMRYDHQKEHLVCTRAVGIEPALAEKLSIDSGRGIAGQVFTTGSTVVACAMNNEKQNGRRYESDDFLSTPLVTTYMTACEERLGVLNVTDKADGKPFTSDEIEALCSIAVSTAIALRNVEQRNSLKHSIRALLLTVGRLSEYRDEETGLHLERVRDYSRVLARQLAKNPQFSEVVTPEFIEDLHQAAPLHDLGKVAIPDEILNKPGKLTDEEFQIMKTHTTIGRHTLSLAIDETGPEPLLQMCLDIAYCHHERWDGRGYPRGLSGEGIPLTARIIGLVDAYDAITSQRCYKPAVSHAKTVEIIRKERGQHFDPAIVDAFLEVANEFDRIRAAKADEIDLLPEFVATPR